MPNKTIYVSDADLPLFEKAQELYGSNLSSTIVRVLRHAIERGNKCEADDTEADFHDVIIEAGQNGCYIKQRFSGRLIAKWKTGSADKVSQTIRLYETKNGRYALYSMSKTNWESYDWYGWKPSKEKKKERPESGTCMLEVFESFEAFKDRIPKEICDIVAKKLSGVTIEDLDI